MKKDTLFWLIGLFLISVLLLDAIPALKQPAPAVPLEPAASTAVLQSTGEPTVPATEPPETVPPTTLPPETEAPTEPEGTLSFNTCDITFRLPGDSWEVYSGSLPKEYVTFSSDDPAIVTFENGVVTAVGSGTANVHASFGGETISCVIRNVFDPREVKRMPVLSPPEVFEGASAFFDDAVFVGDSVTLKLSYYAASSALLGSAQFLVRGSYSVGHAVNGTMAMTYQGSELSLTDAIAATGAKKAFFMLGMNDIGYHGIPKTMENWSVLLEQVREALPDLEIYIQSMTPVWTGGEKGSLNNANVDTYNEKLKAFAEDNGCGFIDIAPYMKDSTGGLATRYCSDQYVHLTDAGASAWVKVLKDFAGY